MKSYIYTSLWLSQKHDWNFERYDVLGLLARLGWPVGGKLVAHTKTHDKPRCVESLALGDLPGTLQPSGSCQVLPCEFCADYGKAILDQILEIPWSFLQGGYTTQNKPCFERRPSCVIYIVTVTNCGEQICRSVLGRLRSQKRLGPLHTNAGTVNPNISFLHALLLV